MMNFSAEKVQEIVEEKEAEYKKLEEEYSFLKEEYRELEEVCQDLKKENTYLVSSLFHLKLTTSGISTPFSLIDSL